MTLCYNIAIIVITSGLFIYSSCILFITMICYRSVTETSGSRHHVKHYSGDQFDSSSEHIATQLSSNRQSSDKLRSAAGASQKTDRSARVQQNDKDHSQCIDDEPIPSHGHSGIY